MRRSEKATQLDSYGEMFDVQSHCTERRRCHKNVDTVVPRLQAAVLTATCKRKETSTTQAHPFSERVVALQPTYCSTDEALVALAASVLGDLNGRTLHMSPRSCQNRPNSPSGPPWLGLVLWGS